MLQAIAIYDVKAKCWSAPFFERTIGLALRGFIDEANNPQSRIGRYPADFTMFHVGEYDEETGIYQQFDIKVNKGCALEYVHQPVTHLENGEQIGGIPTNLRAEA